MDQTSPQSSPKPTSHPRRHRTAQGIALLTLDLTAWVAGFVAATWTRYEFTLTTVQLAAAVGAALLAAVLHAAVTHVHLVARGRHPVGSAGEARALAGTSALTALVLTTGLLATVTHPVPVSTPPVGGAVALLLMLTVRTGHRHLRDRRSRPSGPSATRTLIYGVDPASQQLLRALRADPDGRYLPVGLIDDHPDQRRLCLDGVRVLGGREQIGELVARTGARTLIFSMAGADATLVRDVRARALRAGAEFKVLPSAQELLDRPVAVTDVRDVQVADLLGRQQRVTELALDRDSLRGRRVLVTGAGGSIGSELCRQIARCDPGELMMLDRDESALHALQMSLHGRALLDGPELILADIRDGEGLARTVANRQPDIVFHAAALKHLPLLQRHPGEAIQTNVWGTLAVLDACRDVPDFVNISTDKAANPISVLGYSKRITERLTAYHARQVEGRYLSVRFGNVLSSRGSVLNAFRAQLDAGVPITVTHPDVTRYFMTVQEAVHLVLQAAAIGRSGEALVLDMGQPVRIADVARRLVAESDTSTEIVFTGLRPGEKLHEDLFGVGELDSRPLHPLISHVPVPALHPDEVRLLDPYVDPDELIKKLAVLCDEPAWLATGGTAVPTR